MITKQIAGILYSYGHNLVREGTEQILSIKGVYEVGDTLKMDLHYNGKHWASEPMSKIGKEFFILAREMDLTKPIEGVGVPIEILVNKFTDGQSYDFDENEMSDIEEQVLSIVKDKSTRTVDMDEQLLFWHFNLDFPEGTTTNLI